MSRHAAVSLALVFTLNAACTDSGYGIPIKMDEMEQQPDQDNAIPDISPDLTDQEVLPDLASDEMPQGAEDMSPDADMSDDDMRLNMGLEILRDLVVVSFPIGNIVKVSVGFQSFCALTGGGEVYCWGKNDMGQLGLGHTNQPVAIEPVLGITNAVDISVNLFHACAVLADGNVSCWGSSDKLWPLEMIPPQGVPALLSDVTNAKEISGRIEHWCVIGEDRRARCWGINTYAQNFVEASPLSPYTMNPISNRAKKIVSGYHGNCVLEESGGLVCSGIFSEFYNGSMLLDYPATDDLIDVGYFGEFMCVLSNDGRVKCSGLNSQMQLGSEDRGESFYDTPAVAQEVPGAQAIAVGEATACVIAYSNALFCWGLPLSSSPIQGSFHRPRFVPLSKPSASVSLGRNFGCAIALDNTMECWGYGLDEIPAIPGGVRRVVP